LWTEHRANNLTWKIPSGLKTLAEASEKKKHIKTEKATGWQAVASNGEDWLQSENRPKHHR
jgi:hypothetical protein